MANRIPFAPQEFYHLYNRGTEKRNIFLTKADYERFLCLLYLSNSEKPIHLNNHRGSTSVELLNIERNNPLVEIAAYCLMPNHFHLLVRQCKENGISKFMQKVSTGYTMYFNTKNERTGALFQGRFKSQHAADDRYLKYLLSYIHLNPMKLIEPNWRKKGLIRNKKTKTFCREYPFSSYPAFIQKPSVWSPIINKANLPQYFSSGKEFEREIAGWLFNPSTEVQPR